MQFDLILFQFAQRQTGGDLRDFDADIGIGIIKVNRFDPERDQRKEPDLFRMGGKRRAGGRVYRGADRPCK